MKLPVLVWKAPRSQATSPALPTSRPAASSACRSSREREAARLGFPLGNGIVFRACDAKPITTRSQASGFISHEQNLEQNASMHPLNGVCMLPAAQHAALAHALGAAPRWLRQRVLWRG